MNDILIRGFILSTNILVYFIAVIVCFYKITDQKHRHNFENISMILFMLWALFVAVYLIKVFVSWLSAPVDAYNVIIITSRNFIIISYSIYKIYNYLKYKKNGKN